MVLTTVLTLISVLLALLEWMRRRGVVSVTLEVIDSTDGMPLRGARVVVNSVSGSAIPVACNGAAFELAVPRGERFTICVVRPGHAQRNPSKVYQAIGSLTALEVVMAPCRESPEMTDVTLEVIDSIDRMPLGGCRVVVKSVSGVSIPVTWIAGACRIVVPTGERFLISVLRPGYAQRDPNAVYEAIRLPMALEVVMEPHLGSFDFAGA